MRGKLFRAAFWAGLAVACKASLIWILPPVVGGIFLAELRFTKPLFRRAVGIFLVALFSFAVSSPWTLLRPLTAWRGPWIQAGMVTGRFDFPYTRQYAGTWPYLYPLVQLALWGLGPLVALVGFGGLIVLTARWRRLSSAYRIAVFWTWLYFLATAGLYVKYPRYLLPLYPLWVIYAVAGLRQIRRLGLVPMPAGVGYGVLLLPTLLLGWAQFSIYQQPHPWQEASRWLYVNLSPETTIAVEEWDHPLPVPLPDYAAAEFTSRSLPVFAEDTPAKLSALAAAEEEAEVIVLASRRGYGALTRQAARYAETVSWYKLLLAEREVLAFTRCPRLGPVALSDDPLEAAGLSVPDTLAERCQAPYALRIPRLDESFRSYDAPLVLLLLRR